jgi:hypothetical protein
MARARLRTALVAGALLVTAAPGCKGPSVPHPLNNEYRYLCCNTHYEKPEITDVNYQRGAIIPYGTRVQILEVGSKRVKFQPTGHPPITLTLRHGKNVLTMDQYLDRLFLAEDPREKLRPVAVRPSGKGKKSAGKAAAESPSKTIKLIDQGIVEEGMTREQVLMSLGYPPAHRTPSLDAPMWTYWANRWATFEVYFEGDKVVRVNR